MGASCETPNTQTTKMTDTHISAAVIFDVPAGQDFRSYFPKFYSLVKAGSPGCLYYGFATCGQKVMCREGYKNAESFLTHAQEVKTELEAMIKQIGKEKVTILCSGTPADLAKIKPHMDSRLTAGRGTRMLMHVWPMGLMSRSLWVK